MLQQLNVINVCMLANYVEVFDRRNNLGIKLSDSAF